VNTNTPVACGHCGRQINTAARGMVGGEWLCHTGMVPPDGEPQDCYHLVTVYGHYMGGSCCRNSAPTTLAAQGAREAILGAIARKLAASRIVVADSPTADLLAARFAKSREFECAGQTWAEFSAHATEYTSFTVQYGHGAAKISATVLVGDLVNAVLGTLHPDPDSGYLFAIEPEPISRSTRAMIATITGGGLRATELRSQFEDEPGPAKRTPEDWCREYNLSVADPDGWRRPYALSWDEPITLPDFWWRYGLSTARMADEATSARIAADLKLARMQVADDA
jgi:hypothetical protein